MNTSRKFRSRKILDAPEKIWNYCLFLLSKRDYTAAEMQQKLSLRSVPEEQREKYLTRLKDLDLINDQKYAERYLDSRLQIRPKGIFLLKKELAKKGIAESIITKAIQKKNINEYELARQFLLKKRKNASPPDLKTKAKYLRQLASRGFKPEIIYEILQKEF